MSAATNPNGTTDTSTSVETALTSRVLQHVANELRGGRHPLVSGPIGDRVLLQGEVWPLADALVRMGRGPFEIVLRVNAVDGIIVCQGEEAYRDILDGGAASQGEPPASEPDGELAERERRLRSLRLQASEAGADDDPVTAIRRCLGQCRHSVVVIVEQADILLQDPAQHDQPDRDRVARLQLAMREAERVGRYRNTCILIASQIGSVPPVLLAGSEEVGVIDMTAATRAERAHYLRSVIGAMHEADQLAHDAARAVIAEELASLTEGSTISALESLVTFSRSARCSVLQPQILVNQHRFGERPDYWEHLRPMLAACRAELEEHLFGQPHAIDAVMAALAGAALGLDFSGNPIGVEGQPRGILWFVGPTGVGKTELAKAIARAVFRDPEAYVRLDMSTFGEEHSAERLLGAPPGYVGFEQGGQLTNAVRARPNAVILLDEIEKAHPKVIERLMSIFEDGRVTDAQGRVTYFGETIIIATSNEGSKELMDLMEREGEGITYEQVHRVSVAAVRSAFESRGRPEIFGRIEAGIVAFDVLRPEMIDRVAAKFARAASFRTGPLLEVDVPSTCSMAQLALADPQARALGGRQVRNVLQRQIRTLASWMAQNGHIEASHVRASFDGLELRASIDGSPDEPVT
jgi:energy-coupling factor transporter ATP-binding protein EcfA2